MRAISMSFFALVAAFGSGAGNSSSPTTDFLTPEVQVGDRLNSLFSKTTAIAGKGFSPIVMRISGSASDRIEAVTSDEIDEAESYLYDGQPAGTDVVKVRDHGRTNCVNDKCTSNDQTSAPLFNPLLWGQVPDRVTQGQTWHANIEMPWEIGPSGSEQVKVVRLNPAQRLISLTREGEGTGLSSDDAQLPAVTIVVDGRKLNCKIVPGRSHWMGTATVTRGVTLADEIMVQRPIELVASSGERFEAEERTYTLFIRVPDGEMSSRQSAAVILH